MRVCKFAMPIINYGHIESFMCKFIVGKLNMYIFATRIPRSIILREMEISTCQEYVKVTMFMYYETFYKGN